MEPFVPEPEERITAQESAGARPKGSRGNGTPSHPAPRSGGMRAQLPLMAVTLGLGALWLGSHSARNEQIDALRGQVAALQAGIQQSAAAAPAPALDTAPVGNQGDRLTRLEALVAEQVSDLETTREMVAETLSKLDADLEGSLMGHYERNRQAIEQLKGEMAALTRLQTGVQELQDRVKTLATAVEQASAPAAQQQLTVRLTELEGRLAAGEKQIANVVQVSERGQEGVATLESRLADQGEGLAAAVVADKDIAARLAAFDRNVKTLETQLADSRTEVAKVKSGNGDNAEAVTSLRESQDRHANQLAALQKSLEKLSSEDVALGQSVAAVKNDVAVLDGKLAAKVSGDDLTKATAATATTVKQLQASVADLDEGLDQMRQNVAALDKTLESKVGSEEVAKSGAAVQEGVKQLQGRVEELSGSLTTLRRELAARDTQLEQLRTQVAQAAKARPAAAAAAPAVDSGQGEAMAQLERVQKQLAADLSKTQGQLTSLSRELKADLAKASAARSASPAASGDLSALNKQLTNLTVQVAQADSKLKSQQVEYESWKREVDQNLAGTQMRLTALAEGGTHQPGPELQSQVEHIQATIRILKKQHPYTEFP